MERHGDKQKQISLRWRVTSDGSALPGVDFSVTNGLAEIPGGASYGLITIDTIDNGVLDPPRSVSIEITDPIPAATILGSSSALGVIRDNEFAATIDFQGQATWIRPNFHLPNADLPGGGFLTLQQFSPWEQRLFVILRYNNLGELISLAELPSFQSNAFPTALLSDSAQRIFLSGHFRFAGNVPRPGLARFHANGELDQGFDPPSRAFPEQSGEGPHALLVQSSGKLIVSTRISSGEVRLVRLLADGKLDPTFAPTPPDLFEALYMHAWPHLADKFLVQGFSQGEGRFSRFNENGTIDPSFRPPAGVASFVGTPLVLPDGTIVVPLTDGDAFPKTVRLLPDGALDSTFHSRVGTEPIALVPSDGGFLAAVVNDVYKFLPDGKPDPASPGIVARYQNHDVGGFRDDPIGAWLRAANAHDPAVRRFQNEIERPR